MNCIINKNGNVVGTYIHGIFDEIDFTRELLNSIREEKGLEKLLTFKEKIGGVVSSLGMLGGNNFNETFEKMFYSFNALKENVELIQNEFTNNVRNYIKI